MSIWEVPLTAEQIQRRYGVPKMTMVDQPKPRWVGNQMVGYEGDGRPAEPLVAVAGPYRLKAKVWRQLVSKPGEPARFLDHARGDIVQLGIDDAERLLRAGAVEAITEPSPDDMRVEEMLRRTEAHTEPSAGNYAPPPASTRASTEAHTRANTRKPSRDTIDDDGSVG